VTPSTTYSALTGYGWDTSSGLDARDRLAPDNLRSDFVYSSSDNTFKVDLPNGQYLVTIIVGDQSFSHDNINIYAEGILEATVSTNAGEFKQITFVVLISDGQLDVLLQDAGGSDANWVINALTVSQNVGGSFDFGTATSPVQTGYTQVTPSTTYSALTGYGWDTSSGLDARDRLAPDNLRRDFVFSSSDHTFNMDLSNGKYQVTLIIGDLSYMHDNINVYAEAGLMVNNLTAPAGTFTTVTFTVTVNDGQLNITFHDGGGSDANWVINSMVIEPYL
jgi:fibronectin type 3 domain-containing protein